jgi:methionyl-tRNA formyltransferase
MFRGKRFIVLVLKEKVNVKDVSVGELVLVEDELIVGAAGGTALVLEEVQVEGKPRMPGAQFARDFQLKSGDRLE